MGQDFPSLQIIKKNLNLFLAGRGSQSRAAPCGDSFLKHILKNPANLEFHLDGLITEISEKEKIIEKLTADLSRANEKIKTLGRISEKPSPKGGLRIIRRKFVKTSKPEKTSLPSDSLASLLQELGQTEDNRDLQRCLAKSHDNIFNLCRNLLRSCLGMRKRLDDHIEIAKQIHDLQNRVKSADFKRDEVSSFIRRVAEI